MRTPAANIIRNTEPHRITVVPRSRWRITSSAITSTTGASGIARCPRSSSRFHFFVRTVAVNATSASFMNSDGWRVTGPRSIQREAPYRAVPEDGWRAMSISGRIAIIIGTASFCHTAYGRRAATTIAITPATA